MAKALFGEATEAEKRWLDSQLQNDPSLQQQYDLLIQAFKTGQPTFFIHGQEETIDSEVLDIINKATVLENAETLVAAPKKMLKRFIYWAAAAAVIVLFAGAWWFSTKSNSPGPVPETPVLATENGARKSIVLPDSTKVWLNVGSRLYVVNQFKGATREVRLEGEAFFEVTKNPARPFIVHANNIDIKVLGTAFNVKAYQNDENTETTLYRGLINVTKNNEADFQPILLYPNQKLIVPRNTVAKAIQQEKTVAAGGDRPKNPIAIQLIDSTKLEEKRIETAWVHNRLEFRDEGFKALAEKLERWYGVRITFTDERVKRLNFNGSFEKEPIDEALKALATANPFTYKINNNEILISSAR